MGAPHRAVRGDTTGRQIFKLRRPLHSLFTQLRSGHAALNAYLFFVKASPSPNCSTCRSKETVSHYFLTCRRFAQQRSELRKAIAKEKRPFTLSTLLSHPKAIPSTARYIVATKRFPFYNHSLALLPTPSDFDADGRRANETAQDGDA